MRIIGKLVTTVALAGLAGVSVFLAGCGQSQTGGTPSQQGATTASPQSAAGASQPGSVKSELGEFYIKLDKDSVPAGKITFTVTNVGKMEHELIILKTDLAVDKLPTEKDDPSRVDEDKIGTSGEVEDLASGKTKTGTFDLAAGRYVLICNKPGHYQAGQRIGFQVT